MSQRQLVSIMFTDIVGHIELMGSDEQKALSVIKTNRIIQKRVIKKHSVPSIICNVWSQELLEDNSLTFGACEGQ